MQDSNVTFGSTITLIDRTRPDTDSGPVAYALDELKSAVETHGGTVDAVDYWTEADRDPYVVVGQTDDQVVEALLEDPVSIVESTVYEWAETGTGTALVIAGGDDRGLMYALLETVECLNARGLDALAEVEDSVETPDNEIRGIDRFVEGPVEDEWLFDDDFWHYYLDRLARARFNRFVLATGYDTAYLSPPYPFFVDVPGFDNVQVSDAVDISREEHLSQLRRIGELCHEHGLEFIFATWQQRPWSANPDLDYDSTDQGILVEGLPEDDEEYTGYCVQGLRTLLTDCPEIDGVQLRVNFESGVGDRSTAEEFWREIIRGVEDASDERGQKIKLDLRAKGLTDDMIQWAQETGLDITIPTKYWCESTGLPHHNTQMRRDELANLDDMNKHRRYSYSNLLRKPHFYDVLYRLWVTGTNRIFLWGDPDYARRFSHSTQFGDAVGFEVTTPLSLKGGQFFLQEDKWPLFDDPALRDYEWEDERYWAWYLFFGRLGYSTETDPAVWEREFEARFGDAAEHVLTAYRSASKILPLVTAAHLTRHPALTNWAELDTGGALFAEHNFNDSFGDVTYATAEPSDPGLFYQIDEFVDDYLSGSFRNKYSPLQVARWYDHFAERTRTAIDAAEETVDQPSGEFHGTALDMRMLADLSTYHAAKTRAATALYHYQEADDASSVAEAETYMERAIDAWRSLAERGSEKYHDDLVFGMGPASADEGTWVDRLEEMEADLAELTALREAENAPIPDEATGVIDRLDTADARPFENPTMELDVPATCEGGDDLVVEVETGELNGFDGLTLHYRHANQAEGPFQTVEMKRTDRGYRATVSGDYVSSEWNLLTYVATTDEAGNAILCPGLFDAKSPEPYRVIETR